MGKVFIFANQKNAENLKLEVGSHWGRKVLLMTTEVDQTYVYPHIFGRQEILKSPEENPAKTHPVAELLITITVILVLFMQLNQQHFFLSFV